MAGFNQIQLIPWQQVIMVPVKRSHGTLILIQRFFYKPNAPGA